MEVRYCGKAAEMSVQPAATDWNGGLVSLFHRFDRLAFCWDLQHEHQLRDAFRMGVDAVYSDHVDLMQEVFASEIGGPDAF